MNTINHEIQLNLSTSEVKRVNIKQNSNESHILSIRLYDNNGEYAISDDVEIYISMLKNDKTHVINSNNISLQNNAILVTMTKQMLASTGTAKCELILQKEHKVLFSNTFYIYVEQNVQDGAFIESSNEYDSIVTTLNEVKEKKKVVDTITSDVSDTYNNLKDSIRQANDIIASNEVIKENENVRQGNEQTRVANENLRESTFDSLKASLESEIASVGDINIEPIENGSDSYQVKITSKEGVSSTSPNLLNKLTVGNVETGDFDEQPSVSINGNFGEQKINFRLPTGKPFKISKVYSSIGEMNSDIDNISSYSFVMIHTGSVEDEDTGKLYMKDMEDFMFITDLSGVQGIQGVKGEKGEKGEKGDTGSIPSNPSFDSAIIGRLKISGSKVIGGNNVTDDDYDFSNCKVPKATIEVVARDNDELLINNDGGLEFAGCDGLILPKGSSCKLGNQKYPFQAVVAWSHIKPSDEKYKNIISTIEDSDDFECYEELFDSMKFILYQNTSEQNDSPHAQAITKPHERYHIGVGAQTTEKLVDEVGLDSKKFSGIKSDSFSTLRNMEHKLSGGWRANKIYADRYDDNGRQVELEYSQNAYDYKKHMQGEDNSYEIYNEILEANVEDLNISNFRETIGYILIEDNSKIKAVNPPDIQLNSITLVDKDNHYNSIDLSGEIIPYYDEWDETNTPLSRAVHNDDGSVTASFDKMYSSVLIKVNDFDITQYEKIIVDVNHVAEYNIMFIPSCTMKNAYLWDHKRNDSLIFDYAVDYEQVWGLSAAMLQHTRKQFAEYKKQTDDKIQTLEQRIKDLQEDNKGGIS